jgi:GNAT superfamily N-acetyltransferase
MDDHAVFRISRMEGSPELATITADLISLLPAWFGMAEANAAYTASARQLPGYLARSTDGEPIGILLHKRHFAEAAEIHLMAIHPGWHRRGIGTALVGTVRAARLST